MLDQQPLLLFRPQPAEDVYTKRLAAVLRYALDGVSYEAVSRGEDLASYQNRRILFAIDLGASGINLEYYEFLGWLRTHPEGLKGCVAGILVDGESEYYTKSVASELVFSANLAGCAFVGRPLVEGTRTLDNFTTLAQTMDTDPFGAYLESARQLVERLRQEVFPTRNKPHILALHASQQKTSNTLALWREAKERLEPACEINEINLRNGEVADCAGCPYTACLHFGERGRCFYGGVMVEQVFPAIKWADALMMISPNYNDALAANHTAFINRLTVLFRQTRFFDKALFSIVVSGYSGSDIVARQLIDALNMNKSFYLPGHFAMMETAHHPGSALQISGIQDRIAEFSGHVIDVLTGPKLA